jgi:hypothetical protein
MKVPTLPSYYGSHNLRKTKVDKLVDCRIQAPFLESENFFRNSEQSSSASMFGMFELIPHIIGSILITVTAFVGEALNRNLKIMPMWELSKGLCTNVFDLFQDGYPLFCLHEVYQLN